MRDILNGCGPNCISFFSSANPQMAYCAKTKRNIDRKKITNGKFPKFCPLIKKEDD